MVDLARGDQSIQIAPPMPHVRPYRDEDAAELARCWRDGAIAWPMGGPGGGTIATTEVARGSMRDVNTREMFLAWAPDKETGRERVVGYCCYVDYPDRPKTGYVSILGVVPEYHGGGFGRDLLKAALADSVARGDTQLNLHTWPGNTRAVPLYKRSGYFWAPDTSVLMENYLPTILRLPVAQRFFREVDWYRDYQRDVTMLRPDEQEGNGVPCYRYEWRRGERWLRIVVDRKAHAIAAIEGDELTAALVPSAARPVVGDDAALTVRVATPRALPVGVVAAGRDGVDCRLAAAEEIRGEREWSAPLTASKAGQARLEATVALGDERYDLALELEVVEPVKLELDVPRWLTPGVPVEGWILAENQRDEPASVVLHVTPESGLAIDRQRVELELGPRERTGARVSLVALRPGRYALALASHKEKGGAAATAAVVHCGAVGAVMVEQTADMVTVAGDRVVVEVSLKGDRWFPNLTLSERGSGRRLLTHGCSAGPPFWPSSLATGWRARVEREGDAALLTLATEPRGMPGLTFEWLIRVGASGLVELRYRATNLVAEPRTLEVVSFSMPERLGNDTAQVAAPLASALVVDQALGFPDWLDPSVNLPSRFAESWMANWGDGWLVATLWRDAASVGATREAPDLTLDLGTIAPGAAAESGPVYLYAGSGDWRTARSLWRQLLAPSAPVEDPTPRPAHTLRLEPFVGEGDTLDARVVLTSERARPLSGEVVVTAAGTPSARLERSSVSPVPLGEGQGEGVPGPGRGGPIYLNNAAGSEVLGRGEVAEVRLGHPGGVSIRATLPERAGVRAATIHLEHTGGRETRDVALIRAGDGSVPTVRADGDDVWLDNGLMRLALRPSQLGRASALLVDGTNQLHVSVPESSAFVRYSPWFGGIHPLVLLEQNPWAHPGKLAGESFTWEETTRRGTQGLTWRGVTVASEPVGRELAGLRVELSYLTLGRGNLIALVARLENRRRAPFRGRLEVATFLQPGGQRPGELHFDRHGERTWRPAHREAVVATEGWCAVSAPEGAQTLGLVAASPNAEVAIWDVGLEGAHPYVGVPLRLGPGESVEAVAYLVVADSLAQARLYRQLREVGGLA